LARNHVETPPVSNGEESVVRRPRDGGFDVDAVGRARKPSDQPNRLPVGDVDNVDG
jgi:hypothetical protein